MNTNGIPPCWLPVIKVWKSAQVRLPKVLRWSKYIGRDEGVRPQNNLEHSFSIALLGTLVIEQLRLHVALDEGLLITALCIHDVGEGEIGQDTLYIDKSNDQDLREYNAFCALYRGLPDPVFDHFHRAFLLQFALKRQSGFPADAVRILHELAERKYFEALAFEAIERWDYLLYAAEQYSELGNEKILVQVLRHQLSHLNRLSKELPGFGEIIWSRSTAEGYEAFLESRKGMWIEQKGENSFPRPTP